MEETVEYSVNRQKIQQERERSSSFNEQTLVVVMFGLCAHLWCNIKCPLYCSFYSVPSFLLQRQKTKSSEETETLFQVKDYLANKSRTFAAGEGAAKRVLIEEKEMKHQPNFCEREKAYLVKQNHNLLNKSFSFLLCYFLLLQGESSSFLLHRLLQCKLIIIKK